MNDISQSEYMNVHELSLYTVMLQYMDLLFNIYFTIQHFDFWAKLYYWWRRNKLLTTVTPAFKIHLTVTSNPFFPFSERQRCALWIKKLCEPSGAGEGIVGRKNRNFHAKLLLHMLKRGVLEGPFTHKPETGMLKILPSYMVNILL